MELFTVAFLTTFFAAAISNTVPLMLAGAGEAIGQRAGVLNLGIGGSMMLGGYAAFVIVHGTGSFWLGFLGGIVLGVVANVLFMVLTVWLGLNQIVVGIALTLAGEGITSVLHTQFYGETNPRLGLDASWTIPVLADIPVVGRVLFNQPGMFTVSIALLVVAGFVLTRMRGGLQLRAAGQKPESLDAAGGSVLGTRSIAVLVAGALSGLGGAYLVLITAGTFTPFMVGGLGYIAVVVAMLSRGSMLWVALASFVYGLSVAVATALQLTSLNLPTDVVKMLPFIVVMITLLIFARSALVPPALGLPYIRGVR
jgi:general nucleoside transport system permease protein